GTSEFCRNDARDGMADHRSSFGAVAVCARVLVEYQKMDDVAEAHVAIAWPLSETLIGSPDDSGGLAAS
ncbi:MAG: hypothetical protein ACRET4_06980, partial [Steroidobacteraceae bacterium]